MFASFWQRWRFHFNKTEILYIEIAPPYEILKPLLNAISKSQNKTIQSSNVCTQWALPYQIKCVGNPKEKENAEMANSKLQHLGGVFWTIFVKNFMEIELHPQNIWVSLTQRLPMENCPIQNFPPGLLRTCLGPAALVGEEPGWRNLGPDPGLT